MVVVGVVLAVGAELLIRSLKHQYRGVPFSPLTFFGAICFLAAVANYINKPAITYVGLSVPSLNLISLRIMLKRTSLHTGLYWDFLPADVVDF